MLLWLLAIALAAAATYAAYPPAATRSPMARGSAALRFVGLSLAAALGLNAALGGARAPRPLVALDVSASWGRGGDTSRFAQALAAAEAAARDSVVAFGDSTRRARGGMVAGDASSRVRPIAERAIAAGRPLVLFTDGEIEDPDALTSLPSGSRVEVSPGTTSRDAAVTEVRAPRVASDGDTVEVRVTVAAASGGAGAGRVSLTLDGAPVGSLTIDSLAPFAERTLSLRVVTPALRGAGAQGDRELRAVISSDGDGDRRNDAAATVIDVGSAAAAVLVSTSPDLDARELASLLRGTAALPTRVYYRVLPGQWREEGSLRAISEEVVKRAIREAALVVWHGDTALFGAPRSLTRGALALVAPPPPNGGEWFATGAPLSPVAPVLAGTAWDSLPPLEVAPSLPADATFEVLETRRARRLERRVAMVGWDRPRRIVVAGAAGFWRWRFRGGAGAEAFTAVWGSTLDWLAGQRPDVRAAMPEAAAVRAGDLLRWRRGGAGDSAVTVVLRPRGEAAAPPDTLQLRFGGNQVTDSPPLAEGVYEARTAGGVSLLIVNPSAELLPRRPTVQTGAYGGSAVSGERSHARDFPWLFVLAVAALCGEWTLRRRAGLR